MNFSLCFINALLCVGVTGQSADIWLLDRALRWHYMAPTFVNYYRQMMIHIGLPQWQLAFTDVGLMPQAKVTCRECVQWHLS